MSGGPFTPLVHLHGALFTGWVLLFIAQTALAASHRVAVHRRLGMVGALLAAAMILVEGKITYVHRRLWPALIRLAAESGRDRLTAIREVHTASGKHVLKPDLRLQT